MPLQSPEPVSLVRVGAAGVLLTMAACVSSPPSSPNDLGARPPAAEPSQNSTDAYRRAFERWSSPAAEDCVGARRVRFLEGIEYVLAQASAESPEAPLLRSRLGEVRLELARLDPSSADAWRESGLAALDTALAVEPHWVPARIARSEEWTLAGRYETAARELERARDSLAEIAGAARRDLGFWRSFALGFLGSNDEHETRRGEHRQVLLDLLADHESWREDVQSVEGVALPTSVTPERLLRRLTARLALAEERLDAARATQGSAASHADGLRAEVSGLDRVLAIDRDLIDAKLERARAAFRQRDFFLCAALIDPYLEPQYPRLAVRLELALLSASAHAELYAVDHRLSDYELARRRLDDTIGDPPSDPRLVEMRAALCLERAEFERDAERLREARADLARLEGPGRPRSAGATELTRQADELSARLEQQERP
jgi:hypothetical protein